MLLGSREMFQSLFIYLFIYVVGGGKQASYTLNDYYYFSYPVSDSRNEFDTVLKIET